MVMKMKDLDYLSLLQDKDIPNEILLLYAIDNKDYQLKILYDYRIYGKTFEKLYQLCDEDFKLFNTTLHFINMSDFITLERLHINLNFDDPIPFLQDIPEEVPFDDMEIYFQGCEFIKKYNKKIDDLIDQHRTIFPR